MANNEKETKKKSSNTLIQDALALCIITLILGALLGGVYTITKEPIAKVEADTKQKAYEAVFPDVSFEQDDELDSKLEKFVNGSYLTDNGLDDVVLSEVLAAKNDAGELQGYVMSVAGKGYGGLVNLSVGVNLEGTIIGIEVLSASDETPGLGARCTEPDWNGQYKEKSTADLPLEVTKSGASANNQIEAISGATITSRAVTRAMNAGLAFTETLLAE